MENKRPMPGGTDLKTQLDITTAGRNLQTRREIQPYKLRIMLKYADRIYSQLMDIPQFAADYDDVEFVLEVVLDAVRKARRRNDVMV